MKQSEPETYSAILAADLESQGAFSGHGSAIAQAYHHSILPLANKRDKVTEVAWGIQDFEWRFGRKPEGMWLAETAADVETFEVLASQGIRYTVLSPFQAAKTRPDGAREWNDASSGRIDTRKAYRMRFPSGSEIAVFFYNGGIAKAVAFEKLLENGDRFANRLRQGFGDDASTQLVHIATDGETYGHHHKFGEMALAYTLQTLEADPGSRLTVYGEFLEQFPPRHDVQIVDGSSWSCSHGVERWRSNCGCQTGGDPHWTQDWRTPLRESLDWLRDALANRFERVAGEFFKDPWEARNHAVVFLLDSSRETEDRFFSRFSSHPLSEDEKRVASKLLELQRYALRQFRYSATLPERLNWEKSSSRRGSKLSS
jgi:alpha-amylase/alpha-mannosidase (GH57 family)